MSDTTKKPVTREDHLKALREYHQLPEDSTAEQIYAHCQQEGIPNGHQYPDMFAAATLLKSAGHYQTPEKGADGKRGPLHYVKATPTSPLERAEEIQAAKARPTELG